MGNEIRNAGFLDSTADWSGSGLSVDLGAYGADGRFVMVVPSGGNVQSSVVAATAGHMIEAFALIGSIGGTVALTAVGPSGQVVNIPVIRPREGTPTRGVPATFDFAYARFAASATGNWRLRLAATGGVGLLLKPYMEIPALVRPAPVWDPGIHTNVDLQLPVWPGELPPILDEGWQTEATPLRRSWSNDSGIDVTARRTAAPWYKVKGRMACNGTQEDIFQKWFEELDDRFYFVRPDNGHLCIAQFLADGDPQAVGRAPGRVYVGFGLQCQVT